MAYLYLERQRDHATARGFALIEVAIIMTVIAILMAIALPAYREHIRRSVRTEAQSFLTDVAQRQHQHLVDKRRFATSVAALNLSPPAHVKAKFEDPITVDAPAVVPPTFTITAKAVGDQTKDKCATLTLDSAGNRGPAGCW